MIECIATGRWDKEPPKCDMCRWILPVTFSLLHKSLVASVLSSFASNHNLSSLGQSPTSDVPGF